MQGELIDPVLEIGTLLSYDHKPQIRMFGGQLFNEPASLLIVENRTEERDPRCAIDPPDDRGRSERQELAGDYGKPLTEHCPESGLILGGTADEEEGSHS
ncbi:hypothetical protein ASE14_14095 [Agromyces sp. Root81]|nr:hypothetical protein ASE14_14095 [Agromyces sp. Root81]